MKQVGDVWLALQAALNFALEGSPALTFAGVYLVWTGSLRRLGTRVLQECRVQRDHLHRVCETMSAST